MTFNNHIQSVGAIYQAEHMTFGGAVASPAELKPQIENLRELLAKEEAIPPEARAPVEQALEEAAAVPPSSPGAADSIKEKLETARGLLGSATDIVAQTTPFLKAIGVVIGTARALV